MSQIKITYTKSHIGYSQRQRDTIRTLGLRKLHQSVVREDRQDVRGMIAKVAHLVTVEEVTDK
jgi:large subunit ribosomal protein L30